MKHHPRLCRAFAAALAPSALFSCGHDPRARDTAFSREWASQQRFVADEPRIEEFVLAGGENGPRAAIKVDERGRPYFNFWERRGISADVDVDHDELGVGLKYEHSWRPRPTRSTN